MANTTDLQALTSFILFTDIHRSSSLWERFPERFSRALEAHNAIVEQAVAAHGGGIMKNLGDGYLALFPSASTIVTAMVAIETQIGALPLLPDDTRLRLRQVAHGGHLKRLAVGEGYFGHALNRASRILQVCHPGQVLISDIVRAHLGNLPDGVSISEMGLHHLRDLEEPERLYQLDHPGFELHEFPALPTLDYRPNNLVHQPNTFVGREREMRELRALLADKKQRLITVTAPGGYGKSRLATQLCANMLDCFESGVFEVLLAPVGDAERIVPTTASALGFQFYGRGEPKQQLLDYLRQKNLLLSFDNYEHVMEGKDLLAEILKNAPKVSILVTSREPLRLSGEMVYALEPLPVGRLEIGSAGVSPVISQQPDTTGTAAPPSIIPALQPDLPESVQLFLDRAMLVKRDFALTPENLALVNQICARLDGVPLAMEMAASWVDSFTPTELLDEFEQQLELTARMDDVPERQRSIRASLDWSYKLLTDEQKQALQASSVFRGGFYFDAAKEVFADKNARKSLSELCDKGWLFARETMGKTRFFPRDAAAHQYAFEKLRETGEYDARVRAHAQYYAGLISREAKRIEGAEQLDAVAVVAVEIENIYEASDSALHRKDAALLTCFAKHLYRYLDIASLWREGLAWYERVFTMQHDIGDKALEAHARLGLSGFLRRMGNYDAAWDVALQAKANAQELEDAELLASALGSMGAVALSRRQLDEAEKLFIEGLQMRRATGDMYSTTSLLNNLALTLRSMRRFDEAEKVHSEGLGIERAEGNLTGAAASLNNLGVLASIQGRYDDAEKLYRESLEMFRLNNDRYGTASALNNLGMIAYGSGRFEEAEELSRESLDIKRDIGNREWIASTLVNLGALLVRRGAHAEARQRLLEVFGIMRDIGMPNEAVWGMLVSASLLANTGSFFDAAVVFAGAERLAQAQSYTLDEGETKLVEDGMVKLRVALAEDELAASQAKGAAMNPDELSDYAASALEKLQATNYC